MDQLKVIWANIVKYHFWILTPLVLLASVGAFYVSRSTLDEKVKSRISKLESDFRVVSTLNAGATKHPNTFSEKKMEEMLGTVTMNVKDAWSKQYERQKLILTWNSNVIRSPEILAMLDSYRPIEQFLDYPLVKEPLNVSWRDQYKFYIKNAFPDLAKIIGAQWTANLGNAAASSSDPGDPSSDPSAGTNSTTGPAPLVRWSTTSQSLLQASMVPWYNPNSSPSTLDICYTQEDIWILQGILQVIKATNGKAKENFQAPIKEVEWIKIGKAAGSDAATLMPMGGIDDGSGDYSSGGLATAAVSPDPADNRYVDSNYKPVPAAKLRTAMKSSNPEDAFFAVAKRVPIRFRVKMDQSKIAKLLAECGNGDLMIEVKQVRINASEGGGGITIGGGMAGGFGGGAMMGMDDGGTCGGDDASGGGGDPGMSQTSSQASQPDPPLEVYGIVYLFNPVDFSKLGLEKVTENTTLVTTATPTTTAGPTATPAPPPGPTAENLAAPLTSAPTTPPDSAGTPTGPPAAVAPADTSPIAPTAASAPGT